MKLSTRTVGMLLIASALYLPACSAPPQEDSPGWDCHTNGNRVCGDPNQVHATEAWKAWDKGEGWRRLRTATTEMKVEYVGTATLPPNVNALNEVAVPAIDGIWYVFRAEPAPPAMDTITAPATNGEG